MIINLFSIFDPSTSLNFSSNWIRIFIIFIIFPFQFWLIPSRSQFLIKLIYNFLLKEIKILINYSLSNLLIFLRLFFIILRRNFLGLFPYIFTSSRHLRFCLSLSLTFWIRIIIFNIINFLNDFLSHLTPQGTPYILIPFIVIIESIRLIIRPLTLSIRLTANIIAGHLLFSLLGIQNQTLKNYLIILTITPRFLLFILELSVSIIQAYVFTILLTLYRREI